MKRLIISAVALLAIASTASAQNIELSDFTYGVKGGMNVSTITNTVSDPRIGFSAGVFAEYDLSPDFSLSAELLFSQQGIKYDDIISGQTISYKTNTSYLNLPILFNYYFFDNFAVKAGVQPGLFLGGKEKTKSNGHKESENIDGIETFDFGIPVGVSYEFDFGVIIDARYTIGLSDINKQTYKDKSRNEVFTLSVGYRF